MINLFKTAVIYCGLRKSSHKSLNFLRGVYSFCLYFINRLFLQMFVVKNYVLSHVRIVFNLSLRLSPYCFKKIQHIEKGLGLTWRQLYLCFNHCREFDKRVYLKTLSIIYISSTFKRRLFNIRSLTKRISVCYNFCEFFCFNAFFLNVYLN